VIYGLLKGVIWVEKRRDMKLLKDVIWVEKRRDMKLLKDVIWVLGRGRFDLGISDGFNV
jgi:hypothetical protein